MKKLLVFPFIPLAFLLILFVGCEKDPVTKTPPVAAYKVSPDIGVTTTVFLFDATESKTTNVDDTILFMRWDWNNDGSWDTGFSRAKKFSYRYFKPGTYIPRLEVRNESGLSDTIQFTIQVAQGNSAPRTHFTIAPAEGNLRTEFFFDATKTRDDEDSLNTLRFQWDWDGDGVYETPYSQDTQVSRLFTTPGIHYVGLQVADPKNVTTTLRKSLIVSLGDPALVPLFTWTPTKPSTSDTVKFDASASNDPRDPSNTFTYRWNFNKDSDFDTDYMVSPVIGYQFKVEGENQVTLEIRDKYGLLNQKKETFWIAHSNLKPTAGFFIGYEYGNLTTTFYFDADKVKDLEDYIDQLKVRWDFTSDGIWDTEYAKEKVANHKYTSKGVYRIKLEVIDTGGLKDTTSLVVYVTGGTNETGLIADKRNNLFYGTVKIGSQWWMSENLNEASPTKYCYSNKSVNCLKYGGLYTWKDAMNLAITEKAKGICPTGWHIPSVTEWQQLFDFFGAENARSHLEVAGDTDYRMFYAGQRALNGKYEFLETVANFWTSSKSSGDNAWVYSIQRDKNNIFKLNLGQSYGLSVRCMKD